MRTAPARPLRPRPLSRLRRPITAPCPASGANPPSTLAVSPSPFARLLSTYLLHRYPFRLCPRQPRPSYGAYDPALPLGAQQQCRAATGGLTHAIFRTEGVVKKARLPTLPITLALALTLTPKQP